MVIEVKIPAPLGGGLPPPAGCFRDRRERCGEGGEGDEEGDEASLHGCSFRVADIERRLGWTEPAVVRVDDTASVTPATVPNRA
jgi:hypothetical protein